MTKAAVLAKHDDDVVIISAIRSALTKGKKGGFKDTHPEEILAHVLTHVYKSVNLDPKLIEDISVGNVLPAAGGATAARMAALFAGIPESTSINTVNRQCSSGLTAISQIANEIKAGQIDIGIGAGVESMTKGYGAAAMPPGYSDLLLTNPKAEDCRMPMGITSENVASDYNISREYQDAKRVAFKDEILPIEVTWVDPKTEQEKKVVVDFDDGVRDGVTKESLAKLKPAFSKDGSTHAGNASQVSDGAAAVLLARRSVAKKLGLPIIGKYVSSATIGVPPRIMGVGPAYAIPRVLEKTGLTQDDVDFYEINEAFASQAIFSIDHLKIDHKKVNKHGGAIAIGHPLGCTGARQVATGLNIAKQYNDKIFVTSMCIGSGMGMAAVFVNEQ
ncbi:acetyl-CoA acetyl transferase [Roridomyces roridus]|uniref:Acetyl-CoA acetyl transferase n=1 Tax=Roridomyces roridus TaxID=1738132 RepID=A0AAD7BVW2_9AGAR|nr:acetyl-CoA acetyl transferase [Roridomyces roridus]